MRLSVPRSSSGPTPFVRADLEQGLRRSRGCYLLGHLVMPTIRLASSGLAIPRPMDSAILTTTSTKLSVGL